MTVLVPVTRALVALVLLAPCLPLAGMDPVDPYRDLSAWMNAPGHVWASPDGAGPGLDEAYRADGLPGRVDATIHVELSDWNGDPVVGYPAEDIWLAGDAGDPFVFCVGGTSADADTDQQGRTTITHPLRGGSHVPPQSQPVVYVAGMPAWGSLPLSINSPDLNGDLAVDLSDLVHFAQGYAAADWRLDFNNDGVLNLSDLIVMVETVGQACE